MKYMDEYHIEHNNLYDRLSFRNLARSSIILASKMSVHKVLSITMYAIFCEVDFQILKEY